MKTAGARDDEAEESTWDEREALREASLLYLPKDMKGLLVASVQAYVPWVMKNFFLPEARYRGSQTKAHLRAALVDLRATAQFLDYASGIAEETDLPGRRAGAKEVARAAERGADGAALWRRLGACAPGNRIGARSFVLA